MKIRTPSFKLAWIAAFMIILVLVFFFAGIPIFDLLELKTYDLRLTSTKQRSPHPAVILAVLDERSLKEEGRWPWPRSKFARLIRNLSEDGAKVVALDIVFSEPDENSPLRLLRDFEEELNRFQPENHAIKALIEEKKFAADHDAVLAKAIRESKAKVVLGHFFHMSQADLDYQIDGEEKESHLKRIAASSYPITYYIQDEPAVVPYIQAYAPQGNLEVLSTASDASGYFNMIPDKDGVVRWMPMVIRCGSGLYMPLSIQAAWHYLDKPDLMVRIAPLGIEDIRLGSAVIPTDESGQVLINYLGPERTFPHVSITDILERRFQTGTFKDKIVLVGATAVGLYDMRSTPFSAVYPGLEVHATVIDNILRGTFLFKPRWTRIYDALAVVLLAVFVALVIPRVGAIQGVLFAAGLFAFHLVATQWLFSHASLWVNVVYPLLALVLVYTSLTIYRYLTEERERKKIRGAFSHYVSTSVVNEVLKHPEKLKLGGEKKDLTVLFSDIRGFTTISEAMAPEDLVHILNQYLTIMTDIILKYDGTLDKYMGDAIMAIYGAPLDMADHPARACYSAIEMLEGLKKLNEQWIREGKVPLDIGIGINTGPMIVGNMGSEQRFDYTVMGDSVNLGNRLEGANKDYRTNILLSEFTYERIKDEFMCMELDSVRVKGKTRPVRVYQLMGAGALPAEKTAAIRYFQQGLQEYKNRRWDRAIEAFQTVTAMDHSIQAAQVYIQRSLDLKANPPPPNWDGVYVMRTK